jgi:NAD-dependent dihydropyrimidine dehydrogenase PreA subunit
MRSGASSSFREQLGEFQFALTRPYFTLPEQVRKGGGGLLSITIDPYTCKGCMECVEVCDDDALRPVRRPTDSVGGCARMGLLARPAQHAERFIRASTTSRRGSARSRRCCSTSRTTCLHQRRRRLPGLLGEDHHPPVHGHRRGAHAAARRAPRGQARRPDRRARASTCSGGWSPRSTSPIRRSPR